MVLCVCYYDRSNTNGKCGIIQLFGSVITNDARCTREIKSRNPMVKAAFNNKKTLQRQIGQKF